MAATGGDKVLIGEIARVADSDVLKPATPLRRLFEFLAERAKSGQGATEIDIAIEVFRKSGADPGDASVRVYIHRLRKKLDDFYAHDRDGGGQRLVIPRGEYRLALEDRGEGERTLPSRSPWLNPRIFAAAAMAGALAAALVLASVWASGLRQDPFTKLERTPLWAELARDRRPILVVVGDYYIFGDRDQHGDIARMVREFDVNSPLDLEDFLMSHPEKRGEYVDLDLNYTPIGATLALNDLLPLLKDLARDGEVRMVTASELTPDMIKTSHVVYVGYLSGLGLLEDTVFTRSRFGVGQTYDEILDFDTRRLYVSQAGLPDGGRMHYDYGYISSFEGPNGNRILVLAGTRDIGVMQTAEAVTNPQTLNELSAAVKGSNSLEAVYEVEGLGRMNLSGRLILSDPRPDLAEDDQAGTNRAQTPDN